MCFRTVQSKALLLAAIESQLKNVAKRVVSHTETTEQLNNKSQFRSAWPESRCCNFSAASFGLFRCIAFLVLLVPVTLATEAVPTEATEASPTTTTTTDTLCTQSGILQAVKRMAPACIAACPDLCSSD